MDMFFRQWLERFEARDAVLGVVSGGEELEPSGESHLMSRNTSEFSGKIRGGLKSLGIVKSLPKKERIAVARSIDDGIRIFDLIKKMSSRHFVESRYESEIDKRSRNADFQAFRRGDEPDYMKSPEKFMDHLRKKGLSRDEILKSTISKFGVFATESKLNRVMILMRGVSGSGKSTTARKIAQDRGGVVLSTDDYFERNGRYEFDPKMLPEYHALNQRRAEESMVAGVSPIIIDNTNTQAWEMKPYVEAAMRHGYEVEVVEPGSPGFPEVDFDEIMKRQKSREGGKSMPEEVVRRMTSRFQRSLTVDDILASRSPFRS
jgi:predicted kinase